MTIRFLSRKKEKEEIIREAEVEAETAMRLIINVSESYIIN